jgi:hypothetical protein
VQKSSHTQNSAARISSERRLWYDHPATPYQRRLFDPDPVPDPDPASVPSPDSFPPKKPPKREGKITQADLLAAELRKARANRTVLTLPDIMLRLHIAQHGARLNELRRRGYRIQNHMERVDGETHSSYELMFDPENDVAGVE